MSNAKYDETRQTISPNFHLSIGHKKTNTRQNFN